MEMLKNAINADLQNFQRPPDPFIPPPNFDYYQHIITDNRMSATALKNVLNWLENVDLDVSSGYVTYIKLFVKKFEAARRFEEYSRGQSLRRLLRKYRRIKPPPTLLQKVLPVPKLKVKGCESKTSMSLFQLCTAQAIAFKGTIDALVHAHISETTLVVDKKGSPSARSTQDSASSQTSSSRRHLSRHSPSRRTKHTSESTSTHSSASSSP